MRPIPDEPPAETAGAARLPKSAERASAFANFLSSVTLHEPEQQAMLD